MLLSEARAEASDIGCIGDVGFFEGKFDAGVSVKVTVTNVGKPGIISVTPRLSTSEGEWTRNQRLEFSEGETRELTYFFNEPTINASGIECRVKTMP